MSTIKYNSKHIVIEGEFEGWNIILTEPSGSYYLKKTPFKWFTLRIMGWIVHPIRSWRLRDFEGQLFNYNGISIKKQLDNH